MRRGWIARLWDWLTKDDGTDKYPTTDEISPAMSAPVWHDEVERWRTTGRLDQGPCWCHDCLSCEEFNQRVDYDDQ